MSNEDKDNYKSTDNYLKDYLRFNAEKNIKNNTQSYILVSAYSNNITIINLYQHFINILIISKLIHLQNKYFCYLKAKK